jgi:hypothetical protein
MKPLPKEFLLSRGFCCKNNIWNDFQIESLKTLYPDLSLNPKDISTIIGRSWLSIQSKACQLKIKRGFTSYKDLELDKHKLDIINAYEKGISVFNLSKLYNVSSPTLLSYLKKNNVVTKTTKKTIKNIDSFFKKDKNENYISINGITPVKFIERDFINNSIFYWLFKCHCGNLFKSHSYDIKRGKTKSCGCLKIRKKKDNVNWKGFESISGSMFYHYERNAKLRNLEFSVTKEYLWKIYLQQNKKCIYTGFDLDLEKKENTKNRTPLNASLDRIDSSKGYIEGNVQWVFKIINMMKWDLSHKDFINYCQIITKNLSNEK